MTVNTRSFLLVVSLLTGSGVALFVFYERKNPSICHSSRVSQLVLYPEREISPSLKHKIDSICGSCWSDLLHKTYFSSLPGKTLIGDVGTCRKLCLRFRKPQFFYPRKHLLSVYFKVCWSYWMNKNKAQFSSYDSSSWVVLFFVFLVFVFVLDQSFF